MFKSVLIMIFPLLLCVPSVSAQTVQQQCDTLISTSNLSSSCSDEKLTLEDKTTIIAARTNLLVPLSNFGIEACLGNHWSVAAEYYFPWIKRKADHRSCFQLLGWGLEGRYWFGQDRSEQDRLEGHSVGLSSYAGYYDFGRDFKGKQGEFVSAGIDYLYSLPLCKDRFHLEFSLGLGYIWSYVQPYEVFTEGGLAYKTDYTERFNWFGPTKATVSIVVPIKFKRKEAR